VSALSKRLEAYDACCQKIKKGQDDYNRLLVFGAKHVYPSAIGIFIKIGLITFATCQIATSDWSCRRSTFAGMLLLLTLSLMSLVDDYALVASPALRLKRFYRDIYLESNSKLEALKDEKKGLEVDLALSCFALTDPVFKEHNRYAALAVLMVTAGMATPQKSLCRVLFSLLPWKKSKPNRRMPPSKAHLFLSNLNKLPVVLSTISTVAKSRDWAEARLAKKA
jgi:hypothetical protein